MPDFPSTFRGYNRDQVDAFVSRIEGTLGRGPLLAPAVSAAEVRGATFLVAVRGYGVGSVDEALGAYAQELAQREKPALGRPRAAESDRLIGLIRGVRFGTTRLKPGYDENQVDALLDTVVAGLERESASAREIRAATFTTTRMRPGYVPGDVTTFLDRVATELESLGQH